MPPPVCVYVCGRAGGGSVGGRIPQKNFFKKIKKILKNFEKSIDKPFYMCYNKRALNERRKKSKDGLRL